MVTPPPWCLLSLQPIRVKRFWPLLRLAVKMVAAGINLFKVIVRK